MEGPRRRGGENLPKTPESGLWLGEAASLPRPALRRPCPFSGSLSGLDASSSGLSSHGGTSCGLNFSGIAEGEKGHELTSERVWRRGSSGVGGDRPSESRAALEAPRAPDFFAPLMSPVQLPAVNGPAVNGPGADAARRALAFPFAPKGAAHSLATPRTGRGACSTLRKKRQ